MFYAIWITLAVFQVIAVSALHKLNLISLCVSHKKMNFSRKLVKSQNTVFRWIRKCIKMYFSTSFFLSLFFIRGRKKRERTVNFWYILWLIDFHNSFTNTFKGKIFVSSPLLRQIGIYNRTKIPHPAITNVMIKNSTLNKLDPIFCTFC